MRNIALVSLGCSKNTVDSESILAMLGDEYNISLNIEESDLVIINTCGFIEDAKREAIDIILKVLTFKKKTIVVGCLVERYKEELEKEIPEVDCYVKFSDYSKLKDAVNSTLNEEVMVNDFDEFNRVLSTGDYSAYLKISEGCDNFCAFCAIPLIRGRFHSYPLNKLVEYTKKIVAQGIKEITIISQDTVSYGKDFKDGTNLCKLLRELDAIEGLEFIRILYTYPNGIDDELIDLIKNSKKICHYFDIPLQHISNSVLKRMNRHDTKETILALYEKIRKEIPDAILRTTLMVGYPLETEFEFNELFEFIKAIKFNHIGVFEFSPEEGTRAAIFKDQIDNETKKKRRSLLMQEQKRISYNLNKALIGKEFKAIVVGKVHNNEYKVRCSYNAPDDIDGSISLITPNVHNEGDIVIIRITHAFVYDLLAEEA